MALPKPEGEEPSIGVFKWAAAILESPGIDGDWDKALAEMLRLTREDRAIYDRYAEPALEDNYYRAIASVAKRARRKIEDDAAMTGPIPLRPPAPAQGTELAGLLGLAEVSGRSFLDYPLAGGLKLGEAQLNDLIAERNRRMKFAQRNRLVACWLGLIIERGKMKPGEKVGEKLDHAGLARLWADAERGGE